MEKFIKILRLIDDVLIDRFFEPCAHFTERWFGITTFWLVRASVWGAAMSLILDAVLVPKQDFSDKGTWLVGAVSISVFMLLIIPDVERKTKRAVMSGLKNDMRVYEAFMCFRVGFTLVFLMQIPTQLSHSNAEVINRVFGRIMFVCNVYFLSCTPLPPGTSKLRAFWDRLWISPVPT
jgi:hypothetical protein